MEGDREHEQQEMSVESCRTLIHQQRQELKERMDTFGLSPAHEAALRRALTSREA